MLEKKNTAIQYYNFKKIPFLSTIWVPFTTDIETYETFDVLFTKMCPQTKLGNKKEKYDCNTNNIFISIPKQYTLFST